MDERPEHHNRRVEDRDRMMNSRLDEMEHDFQGLSKQVTSLEAKITIVQLEQTHLKDLFDARLRVIEKGQELHLSKLEQLTQSITTMASDADKSPAGRAIMNTMATVAQTVDVHSNTLLDHARVHSDLNKWKDQIEGVLYIMKWLTPMGVGALILTILRMAKILP